MEALMGVLEDWLTDLLGGAALARIVSKLVLIAAAAIVFWSAWVVLGRLFRRLRKRVSGLRGTRLKGLKIQRQHIFSSYDMSRLVQGGARWTEWIVKAALVLAFLNLVFYFFDESRQLAVGVVERIVEALENILLTVVNYLPSLGMVLVVVLLARLFVHLLKLVFDGIAAERIKIPGFYPEWASTSLNLVRVLVIALTAIVVFPYLPGSGSPAFQGVSIFLGVLLSLGSTTAVANIVAGIVITYTRAFHVGDWVKITNTEGQVIERSAFVTRIKTGKNEEVSIPNAAVLSSHVINYSAQAGESGLILHTSLTIGYDVSWVRVHELLIEAAGQTSNVEEEPKPYVLQTALKDFAVEYELNVTTRDASLMPRTYSALHGNILNAFQQAGIEILSPHFVASRDGSARAWPK